MDGGEAQAGTTRERRAPERSTGRRLVALIAAAIPVIPIIAGLLITSGTAARASQAKPYIPLKVQSQLASAPISIRTPSWLPPGSGALVAVVARRTTMRERPGGRAIANVPMRTEFGSPQALWVVAHTAQWLGVVSPLAGNGRVGWIPRSAAALSRNDWEIKVSLSARRLTVTRDGKDVINYIVAIGRAEAPTPTGRFAVTDRLNTGDPTGPYGCCILALSAHAPHAIQGWSGGNRIAIHSTPEIDSIGKAVSHGCLRLTVAEGRWLIAHIPLGTPTLISS